jgi:hypothetical protein
MRVLHLAPPSTDPARLTGHSFIDEEICAIRDAGVECLTISDARPRSIAVDGVDIVALPAPSAREIARYVAVYEELTRS